MLRMRKTLSFYDDEEENEDYDDNELDSRFFLKDDSTMMIPIDKLMMKMQDGDTTTTATTTTDDESYSFLRRLKVNNVEDDYDRSVNLNTTTTYSHAYAGYSGCSITRDE